MDEMKINNIEEFVWSNQKCKSFDVTYRGLGYRKYSGYWVRIYENGDVGSYGSVDTNFDTHLDKVWDYHYGNKQINMKVTKTFEITECDFKNGERVNTPSGIGYIARLSPKNGTVEVSIKGCPFGDFYISELSKLEQNQLI